MKSPILLSISGASGVGKDTISDLIISNSNFRRIGTYTTRAKRAGERESDQHYFITPEKFDELDQKKKFEDVTTIGKTKYAIATTKVQEALMGGENIILVLSIVGLRVMKKYYPDNIISVYLKAPSVRSYEERLRHRGDTETDIKIRIKDDKPLQDTSEFDLVIVNETGQQEKVAKTILDFVREQSGISFSPK